MLAPHSAHCSNWLVKLAPDGRNWQKLAETGRNWQKLAETGSNWQLVNPN